MFLLPWRAPRGTEGRPSKSLTLQQATQLLAAAEGTSMNAYIVLALLIGARTEELRALTGDRLDLEGDPPTIQVWRSVRRDGRMKTAKSRRTLELPNRCVEVLRDHKAEQVEIRRQAGDSWVAAGPRVLHAARVSTTPLTSGVRSVWWRARLGSIPRNGPLASYGTVSCLCYQALGWPLRRSHTWSAMEVQASPSACTGRSCARSSHVGRAPSTSFPMATPSDRPTGQPNQAPEAHRMVANRSLTRDVTGGRYWI